MANQMIALQARNPQLADPARVTAQMGQMLNTVAQQRAAERQAQRLAQEMDFARAGEERAVQTQTATMRQKDLDYLKDLTAQYRDRLATINPADKARYGVLRQEIIDNIPAFANELPRPEEWNQNSKVLTIAKADDVIKYSLATPVASLELSQGGLPRSVVVGGLNPEQRPVYDAPEAMAPAAAPRATPTAPQTNPMAAGATPRTADAEPGSLGLVIASALETGVMSKNDYDKMLSIAPPQSRAKIAAWAQQNNIEIVPDTPGVTDNRMRGAAADFETSPMSYDGQTPQSQFAVFRGQPMQAQTAGLGGAPEMRQTLAQARTSTPLQMRNPNVSTAPAETPEQAGRRSLLGRESPAEAAAKAAATARATAAVETEKKAAEKAPGRKQVSTIIKKIRGAYEQLEKDKAIASEKRGGFANVMDYLSTTGPGREVQKAFGTSASKYLSEIVNSRKLLATAIKNATGMSAQEMNSNVELQLTLDALTDPTQGIEAARSTLDTLEELYGAPRTAPTQNKRRTSTSTLSAETRAKYGL